MSAATTAATAVLPASSLFSPGDLVDGRYRIESYLGGGGMAAIYRATHVVLEQAVAIKVISPAIRALPGMAERFLREAKAATQTKSEHVARVFDVGSLPDGAPYMVMEFLQGTDLDAMIESSTDVPVEDAVDFVLQACEALAEVHGLGIVHRDLKPANLFLTRGADGLPCVKLIDFGISRIDAPLGTQERAKLTQPETVMGSPRYMAPEQMQSASAADSRSDIYGVGAVLYELLTKKTPYDGETFVDIYAAATEGPPPAPSSLRDDVPRELDEVILRCLRIDPADRFADTSELARALAPFGPAGSTARAELIARVLDTARLRTTGGPAGEELLSVADASHVRSRSSSSSYSMKKRRTRRLVAAGGVLLLALAAAGGRTYYADRFAPAATTLTNAEPAAAPPISAAPAAAPAPAPTAVQVLVPAAAAALAAAPSAEPAPAVVATPSVTPAPTPAVTTVQRPAATGTAWSVPPPSPPPRKDERSLFEDRK